VTLSAALFEAAIWVKSIYIYDKIMIENHKKEKMWK